MNRPLPKSGEKTLVLRCMPLMEKGVGSAWGLPVIIAGKERISALFLSEKLEAPGTISLGADPFRAERLLELETLGIGPLGRYLGGEPIKPVRLYADDFFGTGSRKAASGILRRDPSGLFCSGFEFEDSRWIAQGTTEELFHGHLEFLRNWGFSGGLAVEEKPLAPLLADYICFLKRETSRDNPKIIVLVSKSFYKNGLEAKIPNAGTDAGGIPVNYNAEGIPVWRTEPSGLCIALYEDMAPLLRVQKARCDILIAVNTGIKNNAPLYTEEITARIKLTLNTGKASKKEKAEHSAEPWNGEGHNPLFATPPETKKNLSLNSFLFRNLVPAKPGDDPPALTFPLTETACKQKEILKFSEADTAAAEEKVHGCSFKVNSKFSNLRAMEFKEEQAFFYKECEKHIARHWKAPPIAPAVSFTALNQIQLDFFLWWRSECRRGYIQIPPESMYTESYIRLYARELILCMGKEGPLQHCIALMQLFHACAESYTNMAEQLLVWLTDFIIVYGIGRESFPILLKELFSKGWFNGKHEEISETEELLFDCAIWFFFIESNEYIRSPEFWPLLRRFVPSKITGRKENDEELPGKFCRTLGIIDAQLRREWNRGFFSLFYPPLPLKTEVRAFDGFYSIGESLYTVYRPGFSSHKPLIEILSALALKPEDNPLPGVKARLYSLSLENELLEELRKESDAVREILKQEDGEPAAAHAAQKALAFNETNNAVYNPPDKKNMEAFVALLGDAERQSLFYMAGLRNHGYETAHEDISDPVIDTINSAFYEQFGDLLIETGGERPSINAEYAAILEQWELPSQNE